MAYFCSKSGMGMAASSASTSEDVEPAEELEGRAVRLGARGWVPPDPPRLCLCRVVLGLLGREGEETEGTGVDWRCVKRNDS